MKAEDGDGIKAANGDCEEGYSLSDPQLPLGLGAL